MKHAVPTAPAADRAARARLRALGVFRVNAAVPRVASHPSNRTETIRVPRDDEVFTRIPGPCASRAFSRAASSSTASSSSSTSVASAAPPASSYRFHPEHFPEVPPVPLALGLAGAIPFVALAAPVSASIGLEGVFPEAYRAAAQAGYGAAILSFLGGTQWGFAASGYGAAHVAAGSGKVAADAAFAIANLANLAGPGRCVLRRRALPLRVGRPGAPCSRAARRSGGWFGRGARRRRAPRVQGSDAEVAHAPAVRPHRDGGYLSVVLRARRVRASEG